MRIAILGAGRVLQHYIQNVFTQDFLRLHELIIYSSTYPFGLPSFIQPYDSFVSLLAARPDFVLILTPSGLHYESIMESLRSNECYM